MAVPILYHVICLFLLLFPSLLQFAQTTRINLSSSLDTESSPWRSSNGDFAFGFRSLEDDDDDQQQQQQLFLLAIWFDKVPDKTIVWFANGDNLAPKGSKVELTSSGSLTLNDPKGSVIWRAETTIYGKAFAVDGVDYGEMLDAGNFVLANNNSGSKSYEWESFNNPSDTILPTQVLSNGGNLTSRQKQSKYLKGRFQLRMLQDGNLVLNTIGLDSENPYSAYYQSNTTPDGQRLEFGELGSLYIVRSDGNFNLSAIQDYPIKDFYYRATLDYDGYFRQYVHPKYPNQSSTQSWKRIWFVPEDLCNDITDELGGGSCGFNSFCVSKDGWPTCNCLPGFSEAENGNGCVQEKVLDCELGGLKSADEVYDIVTLGYTYWPFSSNFDVLQPTSDENCSRSCLNDCNCVVAVIKEGKCWKKKLPLSNGYVDPTVDGKALIKVAKSGTSDKETIMVGKSNKIPGETIILGISACLNILLIMAALIFFFFFLHRKPGNHSTKSSNISESNLHSFTYDELKRATNEFKEELGRGAFGTVYKGVVSFINSEIAIAVKKLDKVVEEGEKEFKAEVNAIGKTHHKNLVRLIGFCDEGPNKLLIYEFMSNGSLANFLFQSMIRPDWNQRIQIVYGISRGLLYLHEECGTQIIHCDIKPQNILLDDSFTARISDFGLAKLLMYGQTRTQTAIRGTKGYVAPEWFRNTPVTAKVDVYSFGVVLMEIICCRKCIEKERENEELEVLFLADWVYDCYKCGRLDLLVANDEEAKADMNKFEMLVKVGIWCIQEIQSRRPSMRMVTQMIEGVVPVPVPPCPFPSSSIS